MAGAYWSTMGLTVCRPTALGHTDKELLCKVSEGKYECLQLIPGSWLRPDRGDKAPGMTDQLQLCSAYEKPSQPSHLLSGCTTSTARGSA